MKMPNSPFTGRRPSSLKAFTLIELLITIAVLGLLASLLLAALSSAKLKVQQTKCLSNVKQLSLASLMYANDQGKHAGYDTTYSRGGWMGSLMGITKEKGVSVCPLAPLHLPAPQSGNAQGTADRAWVRWTADNQMMLYSSYGYNGWLYSDLLLKVQSANNPDFIFTRENSIQRPAQTPVFVDANWIDLWPLEADQPAPNLYEGWPTDIAANNIGRCTIARHGGINPARAPRQLLPRQKPLGAINMGLADGHANLVRLEQLWSFYWHRDWQPPARLPWQ